MQIKYLPFLTLQLVQSNMHIQLLVGVSSLLLLVVPPRKTELKGILESLLTNTLKKEKKKDKSIDNTVAWSHITDF